MLIPTCQCVRLLMPPLLLVAQLAVARLAVQHPGGTIAPIPISTALNCGSQLQGGKGTSAGFRLCGWTGPWTGGGRMGGGWRCG